MQRPNWVDPLQTIAPSVEQVLPLPEELFDDPLDPLEPVGDATPDAAAAGVEAAAAGVEIATAAPAPLELAVTVTRVVARDVAAPPEPPLEAPGANTPPAFDVALAAAEVAAAAVEPAPAPAPAPEPPEPLEAAADPEPDPEPEPELDELEPDELEPDVPQVPVGSLRVAPEETTTSEPGLGYLVSALWGDVHPSPMFATNISGSWSNLDVSLAPPETAMGAQFMYISGAPLSLENQVQAKVTFPLGMLSGISKVSEVSPSTTGQPPSKLLITLNLEFAVGSGS